MEYPIGIKSYQHVQLSAYEYSIPSVDNSRNAGNKGPNLWHAWLYIPNELSDAVGSQWTPETVSPAAQASADLMSQAGGITWSKAKQAGGGALAEGASWLDKVAPGTIANVNKNAGAFHGQILRPNDVLVLSGVGNNTISFAWTLMPRNEVEAGEIKTIIESFKNASRPSLANKDALTLDYPPLFDVNIKTSIGLGVPQSRKEDEKSLFSYNNMVMEQFSVTYVGGANEALFYYDGNPVSVNISCTLKSIRPGYRVGTAQGNGGETT